jgi:hypothetical protein
MKEPAKTKKTKRMVLWGNELENRDWMSEPGTRFFDTHGHLSKPGF